MFAVLQRYADVLEGPWQPVMSHDSMDPCLFFLPCKANDPDWIEVRVRGRHCSSRHKRLMVGSKNNVSVRLQFKESPSGSSVSLLMGGT